jgi:4-hydroxy 2-oxovalerate aldolase
VDDANALEQLENILKERSVLLIAPGLSSQLEKDKINAYIEENNPVVIGVNAVNQAYKFDYLFITNKVRYDYAKEIYPEEFMPVKKLLLSNIKTEPDENEIIINFNRVIKRGWEHFDNAVICVLRLLDRVHAEHVAIAGFDGFKHQYNESYADASLPTLNPENRWDELNEEIKDMFRDFKETTKDTMNIHFVTDSIFNR